MSLAMHMAASGETEIELYTTATGVAIHRIDNFGCWGFANDAPLLTTTSGDGDIILWKVMSGAHRSPFEPVKVFSAPQVCISCMNVHQDGITIASAYQDNQVTLWRFTTNANVPHDSSTQPTCLGSISSPRSIFKNKYAKVMLSPNSQFIAFITPGSVLAYKVEICYATNGQLLQTFESDDAMQNTIMFSSDSQLIARDSGKGTIEVRPSAGGESVMSLSQRGATSAVFSHGSDKLAVAWRGSVHVSSISQARLSKRIQIKGRLKPVCCMELSQDSLVLAIGTGEEQIELWDAITGVHRRTLTLYSSIVRFLAFSPDSQMLACCSIGEITVWKVDTGECMAQRHMDLEESREINQVYYQQRRRLNIVSGFPGLDSESLFSYNLRSEFGIRCLETFQNYSLLFGNLEYVAATKDLMGYLGKGSNAWKASFLRNYGGRWVPRGYQLETGEPHTAKISMNGEVWIVLSTETRIIVQDLSRSRILLNASQPPSAESAFSIRGIQETRIPSQDCACPRFMFPFRSPFWSMHDSYHWRTIDICVCDRRNDCSRINELLNHFMPDVILKGSSGADDWLLVNSKFLLNFPPNYRIKRSSRNEALFFASPVIWWLSQRHLMKFFVFKLHQISSRKLRVWTREREARI